MDLFPSFSEFPATVLAERLFLAVLLWAMLYKTCNPLLRVIILVALMLISILTCYFNWDSLLDK
jgi:hypothetical protein